MASLIGGIAHEVAGRVGTLAGLSHLARTPGGLEEPLLAVLDDQIARLGEAVQLLRSLPLELDAPPEAQRLADTVAGTVRLYRLRGGPDPSSVQVIATGESPVVVVQPAHFTEGLLLLLAAVEVRAGGRTPSLHVTLGETAGTNGEAWIRVAARTGEAGGEPAIGVDAGALLEAAEHRLLVGGARSVGRATGTAGYEVRLAIERTPG
jgi:hypothetical protein